MWMLQKTLNEPWAYWDGAFTDQELTDLIELGKKCGLEKGLVQADAGAVVSASTENKEVRNSNISFLPINAETANIYQKITDVILALNRDFFKYELTNLETLQFTEYRGDEKGHYGSHTDYSYDMVPAVYRKLSFSMLLSDPKDYEGGDLLLYPWTLTPDPVEKVRGRLTAFPSYMLHEVVPVTKGVRHSLVGWVAGPKFK